ncbi:MAG: 3-hydroxyacyl-ACP dehydratase [Flavobacteriaceae bacterium]
MLLKDFYKINEIDTVDNTTSVTITINKNHKIFKGHFPNNPVMPGVCMMQIIKEITEEVTGKTLFMEKCSNVKFMALINPDINNILNLVLNISETDGIIKVKNTTHFEETLALKLVAYYKEVE